MNKARLLSFIDAIVAIIATIMVLSFPVPKSPNISALKELILPLFSYILSFSFIWGVWYNHHRSFHEATYISYKMYWYNGLWVLLMSFLPMTTYWVGRYPTYVLPELAYLILLFLWSFEAQFMVRKLVKENPNTHEIAVHQTIYGRVRLSVYGFSFLIVWFFPPIVLILLTMLTIFSNIGQLNIFEEHRL